MTSEQYILAVDTDWYNDPEAPRGRVRYLLRAIWLNNLPFGAQITGARELVLSVACPKHSRRAFIEVPAVATSAMCVRAAPGSSGFEHYSAARVWDVASAWVLQGMLWEIRHIGYRWDRSADHDA